MPREVAAPAWSRALAGGLAGSHALFRLRNCRVCSPRAWPLREPGAAHIPWHDARSHSCPWHSLQQVGSALQSSFKRVRAPLIKPRPPAITGGAAAAAAAGAAATCQEVEASEGLSDNGCIKCSADRMRCESCDKRWVLTAEGRCARVRHGSGWAGGQGRQPASGCAAMPQLPPADPCFDLLRPCPCAVQCHHHQRLAGDVRVVPSRRPYGVSQGAAPQQPLHMSCSWRPPAAAAHVRPTA